MALVRLPPAFKDYLQGGTKLEENYSKKTGLDIAAESWELSTHKGGQSIVDSGGYKGLTLSEYVKKLGEGVFGIKGSASEFFPILIKFIDARGNLSMQVHPDNEYALCMEKKYGKTEMQYILDAEEGISLYYGTNKEIIKNGFRTYIEDNAILDVLEKVLMHKGDVFFTELGTIHIIGEGIVIYEIQQNSNTARRVYDFGHVGRDRKPRELHTKKAVDVPNLAPLESGFKPVSEEEDYDTCKRTMMATYEYSTTYMYDVKIEYSVKVNKESFTSFVTVGGEGSIGGGDATLSIRKGGSIFVNTSTSKMTTKGNCRFILSKAQTRNSP